MAHRLLLLALLLAPAADQSQGTCTSTEVDFGMCIDATLTDNAATLHGSTTTEPDYSGGTDTPDPDPNTPACAFITTDFCVTPPPAPGATPVTLEDIASFRPDPGVARMDPAGWSIVNLPTNFYADSGSQIVDGTLLGRPASVRFTAVGWRWTYGDGQSAALDSPGASWASVGIREFEATATSHVYRAEGEYSVGLTKLFVAEYRFGGALWTPIAGSLPVRAAPLTVVVGDADTVLVGRNCAEYPAGAGC
jgi:hypothetical protein